MATYEFFLKYLPVLIVLTPLVGVMNAVIIRLIDQPSVSRVFLPNLCLTSVLTMILLVAFDYGPQRSGLFVAESTQFYSRIALPFADADIRTGTPFAFGVDGLSLPLVAIVVLLPLVTFVRDELKSCFGLSLCLQSSLLAIVLTLDWRIMCGGLFAAAFFLRLILARTLSAGILRQTSRWSGRTFFGDMLLAGGTMYFFLLASNYLQVRGENFSTVIFELQDFFARIEHFQDAEAQRVVELTLASTFAIGMILCGVLLRLPLLSDSVSSSSLEQPSQRIAGMWIWLYGPVSAVAFALRAIRTSPETAYEFLAPFRTILIGALLILGLISSISPSTSMHRSRLLQPLGILLGVGVCTPNPSALAGMYVLLGFLPFVFSGKNSTAEVLSVPLSAIPVVLGSLLILAGVFQGGGSGDRGVLEFLTAGSGLTLLVLSAARFDSVRTSLVTHSGNISHNQSKLPVWEPDVARLNTTEGDSKTTSGRLLVRVVLIVGLLFLPQLAWQRIRWDVQKIEFPTLASGREFSERGDSLHDDRGTETVRLREVVR